MKKSVRNYLLFIVFFIITGILATIGKASMDLTYFLGILNLIVGCIFLGEAIVYEEKKE